MWQEYIGNQGNHNSVVNRPSIVKYKKYYLKNNFSRHNTKQNEVHILGLGINVKSGKEESWERVIRKLAKKILSLNVQKLGGNLLPLYVAVYCLW